MYNIKLATEEDIDSLLVMGKKFYDSTENTIPWDEDSATQYIFTILDNGFFFIAFDEDSGENVGMLGAMVTPFPLNADVMVCTEVAWWLDEVARAGDVAKMMIACAEECARQEDCYHLTLSSLSTSPENIAVYYKRLGYKETEKSYVKQL